MQLNDLHPSVTIAKVVPGTRTSEPTAISPETLFLVDLCARQRGLAAARPMEPGTTLDWERFLYEVARHKVIGLVYRAFSGGLATLPPPEIFRRIKQEAATKAAAKSMQLAAWGVVGKALEDAGIRTLMVKGPALSLQLYGDPGARESRDIDLLVDAANMGRTSELFKSMGYETIDESFDINEKVARFQESKSRHIAFKKKGFPAYFEIHGIQGADIVLAPIPVEEAFARSVRLLSDGLEFPTLAADDHALVVLLHGAHHGWFTLQWVLDAMATLRNREINFDKMMDLGWRGEDPQFALDSFALFASQLFVDPDLDHFLPPQGKRMARAIGLSRLAFDQFATGGVGVTKYRFLFKTTVHLWKLKRGLAAKLASLSWIVTPTLHEFKFFKGASVPLFVYYLARPFLAAHRIARWYLSRKGSERTSQVRGLAPRNGL